jgi:predicted nucleic acid-binding protein
VRRLGLLVVSALARVEVPSALWQKHRLGLLEAADAQLLVDAFEADLAGEPRGPARLVGVGLPLRLLERAAKLSAVHGLRAFDAVQLASACAAREADAGCAAFACFDQALRRAAAAEGFTLIPHGLDD